MEEKELLKYCTANFYYEPISGNLWRKTPNYYRKCNLASKNYFLVLIEDEIHLVHRLIWLIHYGKLPFDQIDHINGNRTDNRIQNLREATNQENSFNKPTSGTSGFKGVYRQNNRWRAKIMLDGKSIHLGYFDSAEEAAEAYNKKAKEIHGEFYYKK